MQPPAAVQRMQASKWIAIVVAAGLAGCASDSYVFRPVEQANALLGGRPASYYAIPRAAPEGDVRITSLGVQDVRVPNGGQDVFRALDVRMIIANNSQQAPWSFAIGDQMLDIPGRGTSRAAAVNTDAPGGGPVIEIPPGARYTVDLFFSLPPDLEKLEDVPGFDVVWQVGTSQGPIAERTPFERFRVEPAPPPPGPYVFEPGFGPYWWYDPFWPRAPFVFGPRFAYPHYHHFGRPVAPRP